MVRKLIKPWNALPAGAGVTLDPAEQVALVDPERLVHLEKEGHIARIEFLPGQRTKSGDPLLREIPSGVRTDGGTDVWADTRRAIAEDVARGGPVRRSRPAEEPPPLPDDPAKVE